MQVAVRLVVALAVIVPVFAWHQFRQPVWVTFVTALVAFAASHVGGSWSGTAPRRAS